MLKVYEVPMKNDTKERAQLQETGSNNLFGTVDLVIITF